MKKSVRYLLGVLLLCQLSCNAKKKDSRKEKIRQVEPAPKVKLNDGYELPVVGFGTRKIVWDKAHPRLARKFNKDKLVIDAIEKAVKTGYRHIDTAYFYNNERAIGLALKKLFKEGVVKREDLFITTKVWLNYHSKQRVVYGLKKSVIDLGIDFVDLALIHYPTSLRDGDNVFPKYLLNRSIVPRSWKKDAYLETWEGMESAQESGWVRSIGVANFDTRQLEKILASGRVRPVVNQVECNPYYQQKKMLQFCKDNNITMVAYSPLRQANVLLADPILKVIASKNKVNVAQVALRWNVQRGVVVIPKSVSARRMAENLDIFKFKLSDDDMNKITKLKQKRKNLIIKAFIRHPDYPKDEN